MEETESEHSELFENMEDDNTEWDISMHEFARPDEQIAARPRGRPRIAECWTRIINVNTTSTKILVMYELMHDLTLSRA
jgi:hypothetical protein